MKNKGIILSSVCVFFIAASMMGIPSSALMKGLSTDELARGSETVILGEVENTESSWSRDGKTIVTQALVSVSEVVTGKPVQGVIIVEHPGGEVGEMGLKVSDVSPLRKGERVLLFLKSGKSRKDGTEVNTIVGNAQGKYTIDENGIARKGGFSVIRGKETIDIDNDIPVNVLIEKIRKVK